MPTNVVIPPQLHRTLLVYCRWLNDWCEQDSPGERPFSVDSFTVTDRWVLWGEWEQLAEWDTGWYDCYAFSVSDGDEGGPHVLTAWFTKANTDIYGNVHSPTLWYLTQEFDTNVQFVLRDGNFVNTPNHEE